MTKLPLELHPGPPKVRKPRRVLGGVYDAGDRYRKYLCARCNLMWEIFPSAEEDAAIGDHYERYGTMPDKHRPCPRCNPPEVFAAWGLTADEYTEPPPPLTPEQRAEKDAEIKRDLDSIFGGTND